MVVPSFHLPPPIAENLLTFLITASSRSRHFSSVRTLSLNFRSWIEFFQIAGLAHLKAQKIQISSNSNPILNFVFLLSHKNSRFPFLGKTIISPPASHTCPSWSCRRNASQVEKGLWSINETQLRHTVTRSLSYRRWATFKWLENLICWLILLLFVCLRDILINPKVFFLKPSLWKSGGIEEDTDVKWRISEREFTNERHFYQFFVSLMNIVSAIIVIGEQSRRRRSWNFAHADKTRDKSLYSKHERTRCSSAQIYSRLPD